jgi:hypothetical protein
MERWAKQAGSTNVPKMRHLDDHKDIHLPAGFEVFTVRTACTPLWSAEKRLLM